MPFSALLDLRETSLALTTPSNIFLFSEGLIVLPTSISSSSIFLPGEIIPSGSSLVVKESLTSDLSLVGFYMRVSVEFLPPIDS